MAKTDKTFRNIAKVSFGTLGSRMLGLLRDMLTMAHLGVGAVSSAFLFGFTIPNLFRRLMGDGALASAFIPVFSHTMRDKGKDEAFAFLNRILTRVFFVLLGLALLGVVISLGYHFLIGGEERYALGSAFTAFMMPYMVFICIAALLCAALNVLGAFAIPSLNAIWLNIAIISSTLMGAYVYGGDTVAIAKCMCIGTLIGGFAQMAIPAYELSRKGWRFRPDFGKSEEISEMFRLFLPALIGAGVIQVNMLVSNVLALNVDDNAVSSIYVSSRLVELPLGMFTIAIITVYFPKLSLLSKSENAADYAKEYANGMLSIMFISLPAACGLFMLREDILSLLFQWGKFETNDVGACAPILAISALGIPFYSLATYSTRGFHSLKDTRTPVKISILAFFINIGFALALMNKFGARGLVSANVISALFQAFALNMFFRKRRLSLKVMPDILKTLAAAIFMGVCLHFMRPLATHFGDGKVAALATCAAMVATGVCLYVAALFAMRFRGFNEIKKLLKRKK